MWHFIYLPGRGNSMITKVVFPGWASSVGLQIGWPLWFLQMKEAQMHWFVVAGDCIHVLSWITQSKRGMSAHSKMSIHKNKGRPTIANWEMSQHIFKNLWKNRSYFRDAKDKTSLLPTLSQAPGNWSPVEFSYSHHMEFHSPVILSTAVSRLTYQLLLED